jgi:hypothetical protein
MAKKILLAGFLGGIVMFFWGGLWHELLPFAFTGLRSLPSEAAMLNSMKTNISEPGMYIFPGFGLPDDAPVGQKRAAMQRLEKSPSVGPQGVLIYHLVGSGLSGKMLVTEAITNIIQALLVAFLLAQARVRRFSSRLGFAFVLGLLASITTNISLWNWYGFPGNFIAANVVYLVVGYFLVGIVVAAIVKADVPKTDVPKTAAAAA